ncbi:MAG: 6-phosphofructokinase [Clostridiales Family XIII bacterium]|jgi:6-phosphofructokinase 1|nr:6-phosphofructokinase [Clostridiales Family XIII bacterium]
MKRIGVLTSGGDSPGMNAAIRAVVRGAAHYDMEIYGIERGFEGLIAGEIFEMDSRSVSGSIHRGGTILKTARSESFQTEDGFKMALNMLASFQIEGLIVIGGNGSLRGALELMHAGVKIIGLPGTIDNDLGFSDFTIGFDTAVNTVLSAIGNVRDTSESLDRTTIIEVMGAKCGDIAVYAGITGGAEIILIPEREVDMNEVCRVLVENKNKGKMSSIILKAEGVGISTAELESTIRERTGLDVKMVILGYLQRGGSPTAKDRMIASRLGYEAVRLLHNDESGKAVGIIGGEARAFELAEALEMKKDKIVAFSYLSDILSS